MSADTTPNRRLSAIVFTDMVGYSSLAQRDERLALEILVEVQGVLRSKFAEFSGREVKSTGDGFLVEFPSALQAARCAIDAQLALNTRNQRIPGEPLLVRFGIHVGDVVDIDGDIYGDGVNIAARIEPMAEPGGVCLSSTVQSQIENKIEWPLEKLDHVHLDGISTPIELYRIVFPWSRPDRVTRTVRRSSRTIIALAAALIIVAGGTWQALSRVHKAGQEGKSSASGVASSQSYSVAVLPFVNMGQSKDDEYLSDGMTEELLNALAQVDGLRVPGRTSSFAFKGRVDQSMFRKIGDALKVEAVIEGSVRRVGDKVRITAQLINVADGFHLWSETYDRTLKDVLDVQQDVATQVVAAIKRAGFAGQDTKIDWPTRNPEAYRLYLLGRHQSSKNTLESSRKAIALFEQALKLDPDFALAYCGLADDFSQVFSDPAEWRPRIKKYVEKALAIDPELPDAHLSLATILAYDDWKLGAAERSFKRAIELNPNLVNGHAAYGRFLASRGRSSEANIHASKALELDPLSPMTLSDVGAIHFYARDYESVLKLCKQASEVDPRYPPIFSLMGWSYLMQGKTGEAIAAFENGYRLLKVDMTICDLACGYAKAGKHTQATDLLDQLIGGSGDKYVYPGDLALIYGYLGQMDNAYAQLDRALQARDWACFNLQANPRWDPLRKDPRAAGMLRRIQEAAQ
ncbi:MAG: hypothetical protein HONBIEJF_00534 [Fimbriimonadaceae bacterium]|nr:hypothetical protein [Fimbriimonadaceae bacterium]